MHDQNIMANDAALKILNDARKALESIGMYCVLAPISLPQGTTISLHVADSSRAALAANVAATTGGIAAHATDTQNQFEQEVAYALADDLLLRSAYKPSSS